jgi:hypothetical protein
LRVDSSVVKKGVELSGVEKVKRHLELLPWVRGTPATENRS